MKTGKPRLGRYRVLPDAWTRRLRELREAGLSDKRIARDLNSAGVPTAHGGVAWWPATVRRLTFGSSPGPSQITPPEPLHPGHVKTSNR
jgi:hypothetical protein